MNQARLSASETQARMEAILNTAVDGIITIDERGRIETFNPAAERIFGYKSKDVVGKNVNLLMPEPHRSHHTRHIENYIKTGEAHIIGIGREVVGLRADGSAIPLDLAVSEVRLGDRHLFTGMVRDISERKRLEKAIVDASEMERHQIGQDLHDTVGQQLAALSMMTRVLQKKCTQVPDDTARDLSTDATRIADLTLAALTQVKTISQGLYPVELERHGLGQALEHLAGQQEDLYGIPCRYEGIRQTPPLDKTVAVHLYRIAQEAMSNAFKHAKPKAVAIRLILREGQLHLSVSDNGSGIVKKRKSQSGLGLAIMKYRANMIGSELLIDTAKSRGTSIMCVLTMG